MSQKQFWWFLIGCSIGESLMFAFQGMIGYSFFMFLIGYCLYLVVQYMKNGQVKKQANL